MSTSTVLSQHCRLPLDLIPNIMEFVGTEKFSKVQISSTEKVCNFLRTFFTLGFGNANNNKAYKDAINNKDWGTAIKCIKKGASIDKSAWLDYAIRGNVSATAFLITQLSQNERNSLIGGLIRSPYFDPHPRACFSEIGLGWYTLPKSPIICNFSTETDTALRKILFSHE